MNPTVLGLFDDITTTAKAIEPLEGLSVKHKNISLLTAGPYPHGVLFHEEEAPLWQWAMFFGFCGLAAGLLLAGGTQWLINLNVGGKDPVSFPVVGLICYETTNLGIVLGSLIGMLYFGRMPDWTEKAYDTDISHGKIGLLINCDDDSQAAKVEEIFNGLGAVKIKKGRGDF